MMVISLFSSACIGSIGEQNSSQTDAPILMRCSINSCLSHWLGHYWNWWPWVKGKGDCDRKCISKWWKKLPKFQMLIILKSKSLIRYDMPKLEMIPLQCMTVSRKSYSTVQWATVTECYWPFFKQTYRGKSLFSATICFIYFIYIYLFPTDKVSTQYATSVCRNLAAPSLRTVHTLRQQTPIWGSPTPDTIRPTA